MNQPTDLIIVVENREFPVHRAIMAYRSKYFQSLLSSLYKESTQEAIRLNDIDPDVFEQLINIIYNREYVSSPALMMLVQMYECDIDIEKLHEEFDVPEDQYIDYVNAIISIFGESMSTRTIERIAYNKPINVETVSLPQFLQEPILSSMNDIYWGNQWNTMASYFRMMAETHAEKKKNVYKFSHDEVYLHLSDLVGFDGLDFSIDEMLYIEAHSIYEAILKLRNHVRKLHYLLVKEETFFDPEKKQQIETLWIKHIEFVRMNPGRPVVVNEKVRNIALRPPLPPGYAYNDIGLLIPNNPVKHYLGSGRDYPDLFDYIQKLSDEDEEPSINFSELSLDEIRKFDGSIYGNCRTILEKVDLI